MSDRTTGSVRTGSLVGDAADAQKPAADSAPVTSTQAIPTTGSQRAQSADGPGGAVPSDAGAAGSPGGAAGPAADTRASGGSATSAANPSAAGPSSAAGAAAAGSASAGSGTTPSGKKGRDRGTSKGGGRGPRRARLQLRHIDTWSALKISLVLSIALFFIWMVAVGVLYGVLAGLGVFDSLNDLFGQVSSASGADVSGDVITPGVVFGGAAIIGAVNIVLLTALCTVGAFIYNLCSDLVGGLEVTLSERD
jgi:hypothetical protein